MCVEGHQPAIISDDKTKLLFARDARLDLRYRSRPLKTDPDAFVRPPWATDACEGHWADGSFAFDRAGIAGRVRGPDGARRDPYKAKVSYG